MLGREQPCLATLDGADHFAPSGLCQCGCPECSETLGFCVCLDCPCEVGDGCIHALLAGGDR